MRSRELDYDPITKTRRTFHWDRDGNYVIDTQQDVTDVLEQNKALHAMTDERARWTDRGAGTLVGSIPMSVYFDLQKRGVIDAEGNVHDDKPLLKWLQDPENKHFRTRPGRLI